jgi:hypothetical protein
MERVRLGLEFCVSTLFSVEGNCSGPLMSDVFQEALTAIRAQIGESAFLAFTPKARTAMIYAEMAKIDRKRSEENARAQARMNRSDALSDRR